MSRRSMLLAVLSLAMLADGALAQSAPAEKVTVKHVYPPGVYTMTIADQSDTSTKVGDQDIKSKSTETETWELNVGAPNDKGEKKITLKLVRIVLTETADKETTYDSDKPADGQDAGKAFVYKPLLGAPIQVTLDTDDTVVEATGLDNLWNQLADKATTDAQKEALVSARIGMGDKAIEQALRRLETMMPKGAVAPGDSWKAGMRVDMPVVGEIKARYDCKLQSVDDSGGGRVAVIACDGAYESTSPKPTKVNGVDVTITKLQVQEKSTLNVDLKTGLVQRDHKVINLTADMKVKGEDGKEVDATVKTNITDTVTFEPAKAADKKTAGGKIVVPGVN